MNEGTILFRQINPAFKTDATVSGVPWQVFFPSPRDFDRLTGQNFLSVFDGDKISAQDSYKKYTSYGWKSQGVCGVTHQEVTGLGLHAESSPSEKIAEHAHIIMDGNKIRCKIQAMKLAELASRRGILYEP